MTKESIYELQRIDCNCNDCGFLQRDILKYQQVIIQDKADQLYFFRRRKCIAIWKARANRNLIKRAASLKDAIALKYTYIHQRIPINYGQCIKFNKEVSFMPNVCQLETQKCFVHRKDYNATGISVPTT